MELIKIMDRKQKKQLELTIKNILYFIEDTNEQKRMIAILQKYNDELPDSWIKDRFQKLILSTKSNYFEIIDFLINDIFDGKIDDEKKKKINLMLVELKPNMEKAEKNIWDKLVKLFNWS